MTSFLYVIQDFHHTLSSPSLNLNVYSASSVIGSFFLIYPSLTLIFVCHLGCSVSSPLQNITNRRTNFSIPRILSYFLLNTGVDSLRWYQPYFRAKVWKASAVVYINSIRFRSVITLFWTSVKDISLYLARVSCNKSRTFCKGMDWNSMSKVFFVVVTTRLMLMITFLLLQFFWAYSVTWRV